jgi:tight adherence protein B
MNPAIVQIAVFVLAILSVGGIVSAAIYPLLAGESRQKKRLQSVASNRNISDRRAAADENRRKRNVEEAVKELEEQQKAKFRKGAKLSLTLRMRQAGLSWSRNFYLGVSIGVGIVTFPILLLTTSVGPLIAMAFAFTNALILPYLFVNFKRNRRFTLFSNEFPNAVDVIVRGVKAGLPLIDCLKVIASDSQEPVRSEFQEIVEDQTLGLPLDEAVSRLPERVPLAEANFFAIVISIQSRSGGSLSEALSNLSKVLRDRKMMKAKIKAMSTEAKSSAGIIGSLPIIVVILIYLSSPQYILLLFETDQGNMVLAGCVVWMMMGVGVMKKMINFDF